jgi:uncharacterized repeat protein (TIGR01451 family)
MRRNVRLLGYLYAIVALISLLAVGPHAWATPLQARHGQTVPTPTPRGQRSPTPLPTEPPASPAPQGTPTPGGTPAASLTAEVTPALALVMEVGREQAWPGVTLPYTLTLVNRGTAAAQQIVLTTDLPEGLEPGPLPVGSPAAWEGRTLRAQRATLAPAARWVVTFSAVVRSDAPPGQALLNRATVTAAGGYQASASVTVALPPAELPPTGGTVDASTSSAQVTDCGL